MPSNHIGIMTMPRFLPIVVAVALTAAAATALQKESHADFSPVKDEPPPIPVPVAQVELRHLAETVEFTGFLEAVRRIELRPRVSGMIASVSVPEGMTVEAGQELYRIDARPYQAALAHEEAMLAEMQARLALAERQLERARSLSGNGVVSRERLDQFEAERAALSAQVRAAEAKVAAARLNVEFTKIVAPAAGRIGRALVDEGNLVTANQTLLADIVSVDPVQVMFDVDERTFLRLLARTSAKAREPVEIEVGLSGDDGFPLRALLDFLDNKADRSSGTARLRAIMSNPDGLLAPGIFVRVRVPLSAPSPTLVVPEMAIGSAQSGRFVLVAGNNGIAEFRPVQLGPSSGDGLRVVREGLSPGEIVVSRGMIRPGSRISPKPAS